MHPPPAPHRPPRLPTGLLQLLLLTTATQPLLARGDVAPVVIRKMSFDEGEKLLPEYFAFASDDGLLVPRAFSPAVAAPDIAADAPSFEPPWGIHLMSPVNGGGRSGGGSHDPRAAAQRDALARLQGRQFSCPENTSACTNINQLDYCCAAGTTCFIVYNAPESGNVGCCPNGQNCAGGVGHCTGGSTACAADVGGGCCIPGFVCANVGCIPSGVSIITQTTVTSTVVNLPTPTTVVTTVVVTVTPSIEPTTSTYTTTTTGEPPEPPIVTVTEPNGSPLPPPTTPTSYGSAIPPVQPTAPADYCPTGFYPCLAVAAGGGCCRTGRDCATTSCPPPPPMTTITSNGATIVVPLTDAEAASSLRPTGTCASGWFMCGREAGPVAGCCPSGYQCGTASCTLVQGTPVATVNKELPSSGRSRAQLCGSAVLSMVTGLALGGVLLAF